MAVAEAPTNAGYNVHRRMFGWVISHEQMKLHAALGSPDVLSLPFLIRDKATSWYWNNTKLGDIDHLTGRWVMKAADALEKGLRDTAFLTCLALGSTEQAQTLALEQKPEFLDLLAKLALLPGAEISTYYHAQTKRTYGGRRLELDELMQDPILVVQEDESNPEDGCPFAKSKGSDMRRDPLFDRFTKWAIPLCILAIDNKPAESLPGLKALAI